MRDFMSHVRYFRLLLECKRLPGDGGVTRHAQFEVAVHKRDVEQFGLTAAVTQWSLPVVKHWLQERAVEGYAEAYVAELQELHYDYAEQREYWQRLVLPPERRPLVAGGSPEQVGLEVQEYVWPRL